MSRLYTPALDSATGATAEVYAQVRKQLGRLPNDLAAIGAHGPDALKAILQVEDVLATGTLSKQDQETIKLVVSVAAGCDYCVAAPSLLGKLGGHAPDTFDRDGDGKPADDDKRVALVRFVRTLVETSGTVDKASFDRIKAAGYTDAELVDISLAVAITAFTNTFNRINGTTIDFPSA